MKGETTKGQGKPPMIPETEVRSMQESAMQRDLKGNSHTMVSLNTLIKTVGKQVANGQARMLKSPTKKTLYKYRKLIAPEAIKQAKLQNERRQEVCSKNRFSTTM